MADVATAPQVNQKPARTTVSDSHRKAAQVTQARIRSTLGQAAELQLIAFQTVAALREAASEEESNLARARAQAVASAIKAWDIAVDRIRELQGKPRAGSRRPAPEKPRREKAKLSTLPPE